MKECGKASGRTILMSKGSFDKWFCCKQKRDAGNDTGKMDYKAGRCRRG